MDIIPLQNLYLFLTAGLVLVVTPGPVVLYVVTRSIDQGRKAGMASVLGAELGNFMHVLAAALGLSAILMSSALAFDVVKYLGAAYLIYLGVRKLMAKDEEATDVIVEPESNWRIFSQGFIVAVLNPKTALFFLAFLPQFVDVSRGNVTVQILFLGTLLTLLATFTDTCYAMLAGFARRWLRGNRRFLRFQRYFTGTIYVGLGITAALAGSNRK